MKRNDEAVSSTQGNGGEVYIGFLGADELRAKCWLLLKRFSVEHL